MGMLSFIVGLCVFLTALFPNLAYFMIIPATVGLIIGICKFSKDQECCLALSAIVLNALALFMAFFWTAILAVATTEAIDNVLTNSPPQNSGYFYPITAHHLIPQTKNTMTTVPIPVKSQTTPVKK